LRIRRWSETFFLSKLTSLPNPARNRSLSFRALLTGVLLLLLGGTATVLIGLSTWFGSRNLRELTHIIAVQTLSQVDAKVQLLLQRAVDQNRQIVQVLGPRVLSPTNFPATGIFLAESLRAQTSVARLTFVLDPSGEFVQAERQTNGQIWIREGYRTGGESLTVLYWNWQGTNRLVSHTTNLPADTVLAEIGFREARSRGRSGWTAAYLWDESMTGVQWAIRYVSPVRGTDGTNRAFIAASLTLTELNSYLLTLDHQIPGYVAIVEEQGTGRTGPTGERSPRVLGHPNSSWVGRLTSTNLPGDPVLTSYVNALIADPQFGTGQLRLGDYGREFRTSSTNYLGSFRRLQRPEDPRWILLMMMPLSEVVGGVAQNLRWAAGVAVAFLLIAIVTALGLARRIAEPMRQLSRDAHALSQLEFDARPRPLSAIREIRQLEQALGDARTNLRSFRKYVPSDLVNSLVTSGAEAILGGQSARLTVLFSDVVEFTRIAETVSAQKLVEHLGNYLGAVSTIIQENQGTVDKFIGDGVMAFWGAPQPNANHALDACTAAWRLQQTLDELNARWIAAGEVAFPTRIGLNTGTVIVGNIGSDSRMNYTAVGDPVNVASRLESLNRVFGTRILLSEDTRLAAGDTLLTRPVARIAVKGSQRGFVVYELLGLETEPDATAQRLADLTAPAFFACEQGRWRESLNLYQSLLQEFPNDQVAQTQCEFIRENEALPGPGETEIVHRMTSK